MVPCLIESGIPSRNLWLNSRVLSFPSIFRLNGRLWVPFSNFEVSKVEVAEMFGGRGADDGVLKAIKRVFDKEDVGLFLLSRKAMV